MAKQKNNFISNFFLKLRLKKLKGKIEKLNKRFLFLEDRLRRGVIYVKEQNEYLKLKEEIKKMVQKYTIENGKIFPANDKVESNSEQPVQAQPVQPNVSEAQQQPQQQEQVQQQRQPTQEEYESMMANAEQERMQQEQIRQAQLQEQHRRHLEAENEIYLAQQEAEKLEYERDLKHRHSMLQQEALRQQAMLQQQSMQQQRQPVQLSQEEFEQLEYERQRELQKHRDEALRQQAMQQEILRRRAMQQEALRQQAMQDEELVCNLYVQDMPVLLHKISSSNKEAFARAFAEARDKDLEFPYGTFMIAGSKLIAYSFQSDNSHGQE